MGQEKRRRSHEFFNFDDTRGGSRGGDPLLKTYVSYFIHHDFFKSENSIRDIRPFCRPLFYHIIVVTYCIYFITPASAKPLWDLTTKYHWNRPRPNLAGWTRPWMTRYIIEQAFALHHWIICQCYVQIQTRCTFSTNVRNSTEAN